jgi:hypothetical protein
MATSDLLQRKIHAAIVNAVAECSFPIIVYTLSGESRSVVMDALDESQAAAPKSITVHEVRESFRPASRNRRTQTFERDQWLWQLFLDFDQEVSIEQFVEKMLARGLVIPADPVSGTLQVTVTMQSAPIRHPPHRGASNGTSVNFTLNAQVHPK